MDTVDFLASILPDAGLRVVVVIGPRGVRHRFFKTNEKAAQYIAEQDVEGNNVYHGCATYKTSENRTAGNVHSARSFWMDVDVGSGKPYATIAEAVNGLRNFLTASGLPRPSVVRSGCGLHLYWTLESEVSPEEWVRTAQLLKDKARQCGFHAGAERTSDLASILRPVGAHHRKADPRLVELIYAGVLSRLSDFHSVLGVAELNEDTLLAGHRPVALAALSVDNTELASQPTIPPRNADDVANECEHIRRFRDDTDTQMPEPLWRACLSVVRLCENGEEVAHEWSQNDSRYKRSETQAKLDRLDGIGPTLCNTFSTLDPAVCARCPLFGQIKTPLQVPSATPVAPKAAPTALVTKPAAPQIAHPPLPHGFRWGPTASSGGRDVLTVTVKDKTSPGVTIDVEMSRVLFYATHPVERPDSSFALNWRAHISPTRTVEFIMDNGDATEARKLFSLLARNQIAVDKSMSNSLQRYINSWIDHHRNSQPQQAVNAFGWYGDDFVLGNVRFKPDGTTDIVALHGTAKARAEHLVTTGDVGVWSDLVAQAYNNDQSYAWQFALLTSLGAPLLQLLGTVQGVTVYMHSEESGYGKTTAEQVALSVWGRPAGLTLASGRITTNALAANLGAFRNLPTILDELTAMDNKSACDLVHTVSSGLPKERCAQTGELLHRDHTWRTFMLASGNTLLSEKMGQHRAHAEAEVARLWEYTVPKIEAKERHLTPAQAFEIFSQFDNNYGVAGVEFIHYVVQNKAAVIQLLKSVHVKLGKRLQITQTERFWGSLLTCVVSAHMIGTKLGLISFPLASLMEWITQTLATNRGGMAEAVTNYNDAMYRMLAEYHGQMLVTEGKGSAYGGKDAYIYRHPTAGKPLVGRVIVRTPGPLGGPDPEAIYLAVSAAKDWCNRNNVSYREVVKASIAKRLVRASTTRFQLGLGCPSYLPITQPMECLVLDLAMVQSAVGNISASLAVVQGGKTGP